MALPTPALPTPTDLMRAWCREDMIFGEEGFWLFLRGLLGLTLLPL